MPQTSSRTRFRWPVWTLVLGAVVLVHVLLFGVVHNVVDMRPCLVHLPDPLFRFVPLDERWSLISVSGYGLVAAITVVLLFVQAFRGSEAPVLRLGLGLVVTSSLRSVTLLLIPVCRASMALGSAAPLRFVSLRDPHFYTLGMRGFAVNDLVFSGHTAFFLLLLFVMRDWPRAARFALAAFTLLMVYALLATREHYTVDLLLAVPVAVFADRVALWTLARTPTR